MHSLQLSLLSSLALVGRIAASTPPTYSGYTLEWDAPFNGAAGTQPDSSKWNIITGYLGVNDEWEEYTSSSENVQDSGGDTVQLVPWKDSSTTYGWTSGRIESVYTFTPTAGKITRVEAELRMGTDPQADKQGMWPAFWMLGESYRQGGSWPACGEIDAMEMVDGVLTGYGTMHCDVYPNGICNEPDGLQGSISVADYSWHTWRIQWDRTPSSWESETITWYYDGTSFHTITGSQIGDSSVWAAVCHDPLYFILNLAVGGDWPGDPNSSTTQGYGNMLEVAYVAHYVSS